MNESKKRIAFAIIVPIIVAVVVIGLGWMLQDVAEEVIDNLDQEQSEERIAGVEDVYGTYTENPLTITEKTIWESSDYDYNEITYVQISGLKDKDIENSINEEIENLALDYYKQYSSYEYCDFYASVSANFSNVLSIHIYENVATDDSYDYYTTGLNYDLTTGEKIELKDLFTSFSDGRDVIEQAAYDELTTYYVLYYGILRN